MPTQKTTQQRSISETSLNLGVLTIIWLILPHSGSPSIVKPYLMSSKKTCRELVLLGTITTHRD